MRIDIHGITDAASRSIAQVMLQNRLTTGVLFFIGIAAACLSIGGEGRLSVLAGAVASLLSALIAGRRMKGWNDGLAGFNAVLVGCAAFTFLNCGAAVWVTLLAASLLTLPLKLLCDRMFRTVGISSLTLPFILATWGLLIISETWNPATLYIPENISEAPVVTLPSLLAAWMKGLSQVFLTDSWVTGCIFAVGLFAASRRAALWALAGSAIGMAIATAFNIPWLQISEGLWGFSPALTAIAVGDTFRTDTHKPLKWTILTVFAIILAVVVQLFIQPIFEKSSLPILTLPFCMATWIVVASFRLYSELERQR